MSNLPLRAIGGRPRLASSRVRIKLPMLKEAFFGCSLRTGCLVIGWLGIIGSLLIGVPMFVGEGDILAALVPEKDSKPLDNAVAANENKNVKACDSWIVLVLFLPLLSGFIFSCLLIGIYKERRFCMVPLMIMQIMGIFGSLFTIPFGALVFWETSLPWIFSYFISLYIISSVLFNVAVEFYFFLIISSFYRLLAQKDHGFISSVDSQYPLKQSSLKPRMCLINNMVDDKYLGLHHQW